MVSLQRADRLSEFDQVIAVELDPKARGVAKAVQANLDVDGRGNKAYLNWWASAGGRQTVRSARVRSVWSLT